MRRQLKLALAAAGALLWPALATAQNHYASDFESLAASPGGIPLTGQEGYYLPAGTTSVDFLAFTYAGNTLGVPANPGGGDRFIAGTGPGSPTFARAERAVSYGNCAGLYVFAFDVYVDYHGTLPSAQNIGSFSAQPFPGSSSFIALARWTDPATATQWNADYVWFDAAGTQLTESVPDPGFQNLAAGKWYRWETEVWMNANRIHELRIIDLQTSTVARYTPPDRYLWGGATLAVPPTGMRFFAGGGVAGNTMAFDNAAIYRRPLVATVVDVGPGCGPTLDIWFEPNGNHARICLRAEGAFAGGRVFWIWGFSPMSYTIPGTTCTLYQGYVWGTSDSVDSVGVARFERSWPNSLPGLFRIQAVATRLDANNQLELMLSNGKLVECH